MNKRVVWVSLCLGSFLLLVGSMFWGVQGTEGTDTWQYLPLVARPHPFPIIHYFQANVTIADPGDTIELQWGTENALQVTLYHLLPSGQFGTFWDVTGTGTMTYTINTSTRNFERFMLFATNAVTQTASAMLTIPLTCPDTWFFSPHPDICPAYAAIVSPGAEQTFEHGVMLWVGGQDRIYVLFDDSHYPKWASFTDEWDEGEPEYDPTITPPSGYYQPTRGFGLLWREQPGMRDRLGWATTTESGYTTAIQWTSYSRYNDTFIRAADGNVWRLLPEFSGWEKVIVEP